MRALAFALAPLAVFFASEASADITHVIGRGHTIETIAHRYHVSPQSIIEKNHLKDTKHLKPGDTLIIPGVKPAAPKGDAKKTDAHAPPVPSSVVAAHAPPPAQHEDHARSSVAYAAQPHQSDVVRAARLGEDFSIRVKDRRGRIPPASMEAFQKMMRAGNSAHNIDPRLVALIGIVSNHFGGRKLEIVSGFRPYSPTQYTAHSNHNYGRAIDFRVEGVPNEALRDYCRTLRNVGVGYYPNSTFVHLDVRDAPAFWIDYSRPGEPPRYNSPNANADEGTSDVPEDAHAADPPSAPAPNDSSANPY
jgi:uncharacterized protein YcbK (DUF882 family)